MLTFRFFGADGAMTVPEKLTTGMLGRQVKLEFSSEWDDLTKTAVFAAGDVSIAVHGVGEIVTIPAEVLLVPMQRLYIGIYGELSDGTLIIPTIYARGPRIERGADPYGAVAGNPPMPKWKELEGRIDQLEDSGGTMDHSQLSNRDAADQHPIGAISGLKKNLEDLELICSTGRFSSTARNLLMDILRSATYKTDVDIDRKLLELEKALSTNTGSGDVVERYTVTYVLTGVYSNNIDSKVESGSQYYATLHPVDSTYTIKSTIITMGGLDITSFYYDPDTGVINIPSVIGDIVITSIAVEKGLPDVGFTQYDYIAKSDDTSFNDGYINTGISGDFAKDYEVIITLQIDSDDPEKWRTLGCRDSSSISAKSYAMWIKPNEMSFQYCGKEHSINHDFTKRTTLHTINGRIYVDNELKIESEISDDVDYSIDNPFYLFTLYQGAPNGGYSGKIYEMIVKDVEGNYVAKMIPCTDSNGVAGLYDIVRNKFYSNIDDTVSGTVFVCGNDE